MSYATENNAKFDTNQLQELTNSCQKKASEAGFEHGTIAFSEYANCLYNTELLIANFTK